MKTLILQHKIVRIELENGKHYVFIRLSQGGWLRHNPFTGDLRGLVSAMSLATDCLAGKFFPMGIEDSLKDDIHYILDDPKLKKELTTIAYNIPIIPK